MTALPKNPQKYFTVAEAAKKLDMTRDWVRKLYRDGKLTGRKRRGKSGRMLISAASLNQYSKHHVPVGLSPPKFVKAPPKFVTPSFGATQGAAHAVTSLGPLTVANDERFAHVRWVMSGFKSGDLTQDQAIEFIRKIVR